MGMHREDRREVWYFSPRLGGWTDQETPDAKYRLTCVAAQQTSINIDNEFVQRQARGGWEPMTREQEMALPGLERGLVFLLKPRQSDQGSFVQVTSKRYVDREMAQGLLEGLQIYDVQLKPLADPEQSINVFCLNHADGELFRDRVRSRTGVLEQEAADLEAMYNSVQSLASVYGEMGRLCQRSRSVVDNIAEHNLVNEAPSISERSGSAHLLREQAAEWAQTIRDEELGLQQMPGMIQEKAWAKACRDRAEALLLEIEKLYKEHKSYEIQAVMRISDPLAEKLPGVDSPPAQRRFLFMPVVEYYTDLGFDCRLTEDGMILRIDDTVIQFGAQPAIVRDGAAQGAEQIHGRQTAERRERQL